MVALVKMRDSDWLMQYIDEMKYIDDAHYIDDMHYIDEMSGPTVRHLSR